MATKDDPAEYDKALGCLVEANQAWAKAAPVLVLTVISTTFKKNGKRQPRSRSTTSARPRRT